MKYRKLKKFNANQEEDSSFCWPESSDGESRSEAAAAAASNTNENQSSNNIKKVKSLTEAMYRVLSSGEQQQQRQPPQQSTADRSKSLGVEQLQVEFKKAMNESHEGDGISR